MNLFEALSQADAIIVAESDLLTNFPTKPMNDELVFCWESSGLGYKVTIPEDNCTEAVLTDKGFVVLDENDDEVVIKPYRLVLIGSPN